MTHIESALYRFSLNLKHLRLAQDVSQVELAKSLHISSRKLQRLESGEAIPSLDLLLKLSKIFNTSLENLVHYKGEENEPITLVDKSNVKGDFLKLKEEILSSNLSDLRKLAQLESFQSCEQPLEITNFVQTIYNKAYNSIIDADALKPVTLYRAGDFWVNRSSFIRLVNEVVGYDEVFYQYKTKLQNITNNIEVGALGVHQYMDNNALSLVMIES